MSSLAIAHFSESTLGTHYASATSRQYDTNKNSFNFYVCCGLDMSECRSFCVYALKDSICLYTLKGSSCVYVFLRVCLGGVFLRVCLEKVFLRVCLERDFLCVCIERVFLCSYLGRSRVFLLAHLESVYLLFCMPWKSLSACMPWKISAFWCFRRVLEESFLLWCLQSIYLPVWFWGSTQSFCLHSCMSPSESGQCEFGWLWICLLLYFSTQWKLCTIKVRKEWK